MLTKVQYFLIVNLHVNNFHYSYPLLINNYYYFYKWIISSRKKHV